MRNGALQERFFFLARRFVAGETIAAALDAVERVNAAGAHATLDFLGEDVTGRPEAERTREVYLELLRTIAIRGADTNVSVKLSALGLRFDPDLAAASLRTIAEAAARNPDPFVRIDMEGSALTAPTLDVVEREYATRRNIGPALQAYLKRTPADVERAIALGARVRLCKGAYREPVSIAHRGAEAVRRAFLRLAEALLERGRYPGIATHDERLIGAVRRFARERGIGPERFEFQLLYGVHPELQQALVQDGYHVRVYVPFGTHWAAYFRRRVTERPENLLFAARAVLRRGPGENGARSRTSPE